MYGEVEIGFVDIFVCPFIIRRNVLEHYRKFKLTEHLTAEEVEKIDKYEFALMSNAAVVPTLYNPVEMISVNQFILIVKRANRTFIFKNL